MANGKGHIDCLACKYFDRDNTNPMVGDCELLEIRLPDRKEWNYVCVHFSSLASEHRTQQPANLQFARFGKELTSGKLYGYDYTSYEIKSETVLKLGPSGSGRWIDP